MTNDYGNLELHQVLLAAMKDIDKICKEHGLKYFLYAGTLLGAVNHGGFIPWDDDIDIVMFPKEFEKLCQIIQNEYCDIYKMVTFDSEPQWFSKMNKLHIKGTKVISHHGEGSRPIFIDICKLHNVPDRAWQRTIQRKQIELINLVLGVQSGEIVPTSVLAKITLGNLSKIRKHFWGRKLDRIMTKFDHKSTEYVGIMCNTLTRNPYTGMSGYETDMVKREWYEHPKLIKFEDTYFLSIQDPKADLDIRYGSRWAEPYPEEKRISKHDVKSYEISPEVRERLGILQQKN